MKCYICDNTRPTGGMRYNIADAIGICHNCGVGVCAQHGHKEARSGSLLLCPQCASLDNRVPASEAVDDSLKKSSAHI